MLAEYKIQGESPYTIRLLSGANEAEVQNLCERCSDFSELVEGRPPEKDAGHSVLFDMPPEKTMEDKFVFGVYNEKAVLIGVIDLIKDYKDVGEWIIGLMLIDPGERKNGLGRKVHDFLKTLVSENHGQKLRIAVVEENTNGFHFWCRMGYVEKERVARTYGNKEHTVIAMNLLL